MEKTQKYFDLQHILIISGIRRTGKSTLLCQIMNLLNKNWYYFNFEDERLINFEVSDFNQLYEIFIELYGEKKIFFFDEIQNIIGWERFIRRMYDDKFKFFITGSNASLLSKELGTKLTGRYISCNLFSFSFSEYLLFNKYKFDKDDLYKTKKRGEIKRYFNKYLNEGGMPEYLKYKTQETLKKVYDDILYRDIVARYNIKDIKFLRELSFYLLTNVSSLFSYNNLKKLFNLGSVNTIKNYVDYLENCFLFFVVPIYADSLKKQIVSPKKIYCVDNGFINAISFKFLENKGKLLENLVFLELKRRNKDIYYYKTKNNLEVDFLIREKQKIKELIQVSWSLADKKTKDREIQALLKAMTELKLKNGLILTEDEEDIIKIDKKIITILPVYKWLLNEKNF
ncbi:MAG: ATP-binding protein [bacterium]